jgi:hypothetical protein
VKTTTTSAGQRPAEVASEGHKFKPSLNLVAWERELADDPDRDYLLDGIRHGFRIVDPGSQPEPCHVTNSKSALRHSDKVEQELIKEIKEGRYEVVDYKPTIVSGLAAIEKTDGSVRLIHDCSRPVGHGANDYATKDAQLRYQSIKDAIELVTPGAFLAKVDLKSAYRSVAIHPSQYPFMGLQWTFKGQSVPSFIQEKFLCFGARKSPSIFHRLTQAVRRFMAARGFNIVAYLDDFLIVSDNKQHCLQGYTVLIQLLRELGFAIAWQKVVDPTQSLTFLGLDIDTLSMTLRLPEHKLADLLTLLHQFKARTRASKRQLQKLAGKLAYASHLVVHGGRTYLQRVLDILRPLQQPHHKVILTKDFQQDIVWWIDFLCVFNFRPIMEPCRPEIHVFTDACGEGGGMVCDFDWAYVNWAIDMPGLSTAHINVKETMTSLLALYRWAPFFTNCAVVLHTDNMCTKAIINNGACRNELLMVHLRNLFWLSQVFNFTVKCLHLPGVNNITADAFSRLHSGGHFLYSFSIASNARPCTANNVATVLASHMSNATLLYLLQTKPWAVH